MKRFLFYMILVVVLLTLAAFGYIYFRVDTKVLEPINIEADIQGNPNPDFNVLLDFDPNFDQFVACAKLNPLLDSLFQNSLFTVSWIESHKSKNLFPVIQFHGFNDVTRVQQEFSTNLNPESNVKEIICLNERKIYCLIAEKNFVFSPSAQILEEIPKVINFINKDKRLTENPNSFLFNLSLNTFVNIAQSCKLFPNCNTPYFLLDSISGRVFSTEKEFLVRFDSKHNKDKESLWNNLSRGDQMYAKYIPRDVIDFEAFSFDNGPILLDRIKKLPPYKSEIEKYISQYQFDPVEEVSSIIGSWIWTANLDFMENGENAKIAGVQTSDINKVNAFLYNYCKVVKQEKIVFHERKKELPIYELVVGNFFNYIFPSTVLRSDPTYILFYENHLWLASSPQILRFAFSSFHNSVTMDQIVNLNQSTYVYYANMKKRRASLSSTDNRSSSQFLRSFLTKHTHVNEFILEIDYATDPYYGIFRIW